jgi:hypothetical protein
LREKSARADEPDFDASGVTHIIEGSLIGHFKAMGDP